MDKDEQGFTRTEKETAHSLFHTLEELLKFNNHHAITVGKLWLLSACTQHALFSDLNDLINKSSKNAFSKFKENKFFEREAEDIVYSKGCYCLIIHSLKWFHIWTLVLYSQQKPWLVRPGIN